jgi:phosphodiesterase/alkaline phosphatase D-like protein
MSLSGKHFSLLLWGILFIGLHTLAQACPPNPPTLLTATAVSSSQINLSWTDNSNNETGFKIEESPNDDQHFTQIDTVGANVTTYSRTGLSANTRYYYRVRAYNGNGNSSYSNEANAWTFLQTPTNLTAAAVSSNQINLAWTYSYTGQTGFAIEQSTPDNQHYTQITTVGANVTSYKVTGLTPSTVYYYRIRAYNSNVYSGYSTPANATTMAGSGIIICP